MSKKWKKYGSYALPFALVIVGFIVSEILIAGGNMSRSLKGQLIPICAYIVMALSLNLVVGFSGELSLGHAGFMSVGAFSGAIVSGWLLNGAGMENETLRLIIALVTGGVFAGITGVLIGIPVLRLRGDYLAIVTLAFGEIIRNVLNCLYFSVNDRKLLVGFNNANLPGTILVNGPQGAVKVAKIATFEVGFALVLFTLLVIMNLVRSRSGRAIMAIRDNRIAAEASGLNVTKYKMMAFVTSAVLAGMAGALYGLSFSTFAAAKFKFDTSINILVFVVLGGIGNIPGSIIAAAVLTILPEQLRAFSDYRMLAYAVVLILMMLITNNAKLKGFVMTIRENRKKNKVSAAVTAAQTKGGEQA
ncbi:MAG: branched-chain amino acid ABC transporter permease [Clostridia bacterium]|nr:branched-chain amino acid ABC transporter permease [Clostridia bacterium]